MGTAGAYIYLLPKHYFSICNLHIFSYSCVMYHDYHHMLITYLPSSQNYAWEVLMSDIAHGKTTPNLCSRFHHFYVESMSHIYDWLCISQLIRILELSVWIAKMHGTRRAQAVNPIGFRYWNELSKPKDKHFICGLSEDLSL